MRFINLFTYLLTYLLCTKPTPDFTKTEFTSTEFTGSRRTYRIGYSLTCFLIILPVRSSEHTAWVLVWNRWLRSVLFARFHILFLCILYTFPCVFLVNYNMCFCIEQSRADWLLVGRRAWTSSVRGARKPNVRLVIFSSLVLHDLLATYRPKVNTYRVWDNDLAELHNRLQSANLFSGRHRPKSGPGTEWTFYQGLG